MDFYIQEWGIGDSPPKTPADKDIHFALTSLRVAWVSRASLILQDVKGSSVLFVGRGTKRWSNYCPYLGVQCGQDVIEGIGKGGVGALLASPCGLLLCK